MTSALIVLHAGPDSENPRVLTSTDAISEST